MRPGVAPGRPLCPGDPAENQSTNMPTVNRVEHARKPQGTCRCGKAINVGDAYVWWKFRYGGRHVRCTSPLCAPKASDLTQSEYLSTIATISEMEVDSSSVEGLAGSIESIKDEIENLQSETEDKLNNMPDSLQQGPTGELLQERIDSMDSVISDLEGIETDFDEEAPEEPDRETTPADDKTHETAMAEWESRRDAWLEDRAQEVADALGNLS